MPTIYPPKPPSPFPAWIRPHQSWVRALRGHGSPVHSPFDCVGQFSIDRKGGVKILVTSAAEADLATAAYRR